MQAWPQCGTVCTYHGRLVVHAEGHPVAESGHLPARLLDLVQQAFHQLAVVGHFALLQEGLELRGRGKRANVGRCAW